MKRHFHFHQRSLIHPLFLLFFTICIPSRSQSQNIYSHASLAEKIYLQLDSKVYTTDNTIWFKCLATNAFNHAPTALSKILYVELISPDEKLIEKKLIKIEHGIGQGSFNLSPKLRPGNYLIRAYTEWNKNFNSDFIFKEYVQVYSYNEELQESPLSEIKLLSRQNEVHLEAQINPLVIDSLHKNKLTVYLSSEGVKDSLILKKNSDNKYYLDYIVPNKSEKCVLNFTTYDEIKYFKTIALKENIIDLQFFPESGELVHGLNSVLGFKALDFDGNGINIEGDILNEDGAVLTHFSANELGMGTFRLNHLDSTEQYIAKVSSPEKYSQTTWKLPKVAAKGNVLSTTKVQNNILVSVSSNYLENDSINLRVSCRGVIYFDVKVALQQGRFNINVPSDKLPEGIIAFTMLDNSSQAIAERLYFNQRPESRLNIQLSTNKNTYNQREQTNVDVELTNYSGSPAYAHLSMLVVNKQQMGNMQSTRQNILSYFLLDSELKGSIEKPGYYFRNNTSQHQDLEALMLSQGWRKYHYNKPIGEISYEAEKQISVKGKVRGEFLGKAKIADLSMITFGKNQMIYAQTTDSLGNFKFDINDEYSQRMNILIKSAKKSGKKKNYTISIDNTTAPKVVFNHAYPFGKKDSTVQLFVEKNRERKKLDEAILHTTRHVDLEEVLVEGHKLTKAQIEANKEYGEPDVVIDGNTLRKHEEKWSNGLYDILEDSFSDKIRIDRDDEGILRARIFKTDITLVVIDGEPVKHFDYLYLPNISPSEISSIEIINNITNAENLYEQVYEIGTRLPSMKQVSVIAIYTYGQKGLYGVTVPYGILKAAIPVFSTPREFYAPKYDSSFDDKNNKPDLRALIQWDPMLITDNTGKVSTSFYNSDNVGQMQVIVEAISKDGEIGYKTISYTVDGKDLIIID